jgi:hypothetical protein
LLHFTAGLHNYFRWTIQFAAERRLPGLASMLDVYAEPSLLWWLPCVAVAVVVLRRRVVRASWARLAALVLLTAPFLWTVVNLLLTPDSDDRADSLLALWPLLLVFSIALTLFNLIRDLSPRTLLPLILLAAIHGTLLSQQLWGSTYAIWPFLILLVAEMIPFLGSVEEAGNWAETAPRVLRPTAVLAAVISATLLVCGGLYTASEERLEYAQLPGGEVHRAGVKELKGMAVSGPYLSEFEELLQFAEAEIPHSDGLILIPGEDPFYFATGRVPQFPVLLFDHTTDPYSPAQLAEEAHTHHILWLIVKRDLQLKEDPTPQREEALKALRQVFVPYRTLAGYEVYRAAN